MKRVLDVVLSLTLIILLFPVYVSVAIAIRLKMGTPILFKQQRPGLHGKPFYLYKFRTMNEGSYSLSDEERLTTLGMRLRKYSLDELPQLYHVLKGEMSLVGPRPLLMEYLPLYNEEQLLRHMVKPGITGWAQVNGRNAITWEEKFRFDTWYVKHRSFFLDCRILFMTVKKVLKKEGINHKGTVTMKKFTGTERVM